MACNNLLPAGFDEHNTVFGPPKGKTEDEVGSIQAFRGVSTEGDPIVITRWRVTKEVLEDIAKNGEVWLTIYGTTMVPVSLSTTKPFIYEDDELD